jgi:hypothetical protein
MASTNNPILSLTTLEVELRLVINTYKSWYTAYMDNIRRENYDEAKKNLVEVIRINDKVIVLATGGKNIIEQASKDSTAYDNSDVITLEELTRILHDHESKKIMLATDEFKLANIDGKLDISQQNYQTKYLQYVIIAIVGVVVAGLTAKTMITQDESNLEVAILVIIVGLIVYFLISNLII